MTANRIELTLAGAGSGKTTRVTELHVNAVKAGQPQSSILVSTYTKKAAGEIRNRVGKELIRQGMAEQAALLHNARLGTVHSIGQKLLDEFSFELGLSPGLIVMEDEKQQAVLAQVTAEVLSISEAMAMGELQHRLGQFNSNPKTPEKPDWQGMVKEIINLARTNGMGPESFKQMAESSIKAVYEGVAAMRDGKNRFVQSCKDLIPELQTAIETAKKPAESTKSSFKALCRLVRMLESEDSGFTWRNVSMSAIGKWGVNDGTKAIWDKAGLHPGEFYRWKEFRADYEKYIRGVFNAAERVIADYERCKREAGLLDFADMEAGLYRLLDLKEAQARITEQVSLVIIDEFQDTSPLQLAIFLKLAALVAQTIWVGDPKQAIYDFRGTDPMLVMKTMASLRKNGKAKEGGYLGTNYRSRPKLVQFVNEVFQDTFTGQGLTPDQVMLKAFRAEKKGLGSPLYRWCYASRGDGKFTKEEAPGALANMLAEFLKNAENENVIDRVSGELQPVQPGDIAVLCRTNDAVAKVAAELKARNIPVESEQPGLTVHPEIQLCLAGLTLAINPKDALASAIITFWNDCPLGGGREGEWLDARMRQVAAGNYDGWVEHPVIKEFRGRQPELRKLDPVVALSAVMELAGIRKIVSGWRDPELHLGRIDSLISLAEQYREDCRGAGLAASIPGFIRYMDTLAADGKDMERGAGTGVTVCTWHRSKGLEWPVVILCDTDDPIDPLRNMLGAGAYQSAALDPDNPLAGREILAVISPFTRNQTEDFNAFLRERPLCGKCGERSYSERLRLLYTIYTRARDKLVFFGSIEQSAVEVGDLELNVLPEKKGKGWEVRRCVNDGVQVKIKKKSRVTWFKYGDRPAETRKAVVTPSEAAGDGSGGGKAPVSLAADLGSRFEFSARWNEMVGVGSALHGYFAVEKSGMDAKSKRALAERLINGWNMEKILDRDALVNYGDVWEKKSAEMFQGANIRREVPLAVEFQGALIRGEADFLAEFDGEISLVDHKSYQGTAEEAEKEAQKYAAQLAAYVHALETAMGKPVTHAYIHFPAMGWVMEVSLDRSMKQALLEKMAG